VSVGLGSGIVSELHLPAGTLRVPTAITEQEKLRGVLELIGKDETPMMLFPHVDTITLEQTPVPLLVAFLERVPFDTRARQAMYGARRDVDRRRFWIREPRIVPAFATQRVRPTRAQFQGIEWWALELSAPMAPLVSLRDGDLATITLPLGVVP